jgi:serine/threonine-protein kinase HipA
MISGLTLLRADETLDARRRWYYVLLVEELPRIVSEPKKDTQELFRRICFNALISNLDDHPCNHALNARDQHWSLSPAYDLTPSPVVGEERRDLAMEAGDPGHFANAKNILSPARAVPSRQRRGGERWSPTCAAPDAQTRGPDFSHSRFIVPR